MTRRHSGARRRRPAGLCRSRGVSRRRLEREGPGAAGPRRRGAARVEAVEAVTRDDAVAAARGCDVVLNAFNPAITLWQKNALSLAYARSQRPKSNGATLLFPGSVWNYGARHAAGARREHADATHHAQGRNARRDRAAHPRGLRPRHARHRAARRRFLRRRPRLLVRSGDRQGHRRAAASPIPGPLDVEHAWAYLPDFADDAGAARGAARRASAPCETFGFPGHARDRRASSSRDRGGDQQQVQRAADELVDAQDLRATDWRSAASFPSWSISGGCRTGSPATSSRPRSAKFRTRRCPRRSRIVARLGYRAEGFGRIGSENRGSLPGSA